MTFHTQTPNSINYILYGVVILPTSRLVDRLGQFEDPWGHRWSVATHVEDVSEEEMAERAARYDGS